MKHKFLAVTLLVVGFIMVVVLGSSVYMISYSLVPSHNRGRDYTKAYTRLFTRFPDIKPWVDSLQSAGAIRDTFIMGQDGDRHHALMIAAPHRSNRIAVVVHGYTDCAVDFLNIAQIYNHDMGFNVLLPDLHACGKSDGKAQQMGWLDRLDVLQWINIADSLWRNSARQSEIVVHGVSILEQVRKCRKPMLFIHGGKDSYVPTRMVYPLYDAKPAPKELIVFRNTKHARSYSDYPLEYKRMVKRFVNRYIK